mgnify:CR=1 FL=1
MKTIQIGDFSFKPYISEEEINKRVKNYSTSLNYGNYTGTIRNTGQTETDVINNICDMSGNVREWTTETNTENTKTKKLFKKCTINEYNIEPPI